MLELLEVPQLMDTCIRNGSYDDALDLKGFIGKLAFMHSDLTVVQSLVKEMDQASQSMLEQLLQKLHTNVQLPDCLRIIGYLRRLGVFSERVRLELDSVPYRTQHDMLLCHRRHARNAYVGATCGCRVQCWPKVACLTICREYPGRSGSPAATIAWHMRLHHDVLLLMRHASVAAEGTGLPILTLE